MLEKFFGSPVGHIVGLGLLAGASALATAHPELAPAIPVAFKLLGLGFLIQTKPLA